MVHCAKTNQIEIVKQKLLIVLDLDDVMCFELIRIITSLILTHFAEIARSLLDLLRLFVPSVGVAQFSFFSASVIHATLDRALTVSVNSSTAPARFQNHDYTL